VRRRRERMAVDQVGSRGASSSAPGFRLVPFSSWILYGISPKPSRTFAETCTACLASGSIRGQCAGRLWWRGPAKAKAGGAYIPTFAHSRPSEGQL